MLNEHIIDDYISELFDLDSDTSVNSWFITNKNLFSIPVIHNGKKYFIAVESVNRINPVSDNDNLYTINPKDNVNFDKYNYKYILDVKGLNVNIPCEDVLSPKEFAPKSLKVYGDEINDKIIIGKSNDGDCIINLINYITSSNDFSKAMAKD